MLPIPRGSFPIATAGLLADLLAYLWALKGILARPAEPEEGVGPGDYEMRPQLRSPLLVARPAQLVSAVDRLATPLARLRQRQSVTCGWLPGSLSDTVAPCTPV